MRGLIVKTSALGDIVHTYPVASYLKEKFPHMVLDWVVEKAGASLVSAHPAIDKTLVVDTKLWRKSFFSSKSVRQEIKFFFSALRENRYDFIIDLQGNSKSACITALAKAASKIGFGKKSVAEWPNTLVTNRRYEPPLGQNVRQDNLFLIKSFFNDLETEYHAPALSLKLSFSQKKELEKIVEMFRFQKEKILVCPGSAWPNKELSAEQLAHFLSEILAVKPYFLAFTWGTLHEKNISEETIVKLKILGVEAMLLEKMELALLQNVMAHFSYVIAMDSLPLHLAASSGATTFSVFGPSIASKYRPEMSSKQRHLAFQSSCPYGKTFTKRCDILRSCPTGACMKGIDAKELAKAFLQLEEKKKMDEVD